MNYQLWETSYFFKDSKLWALIHLMPRDAVVRRCNSDFKFIVVDKFLMKQIWHYCMSQPVFFHQKSWFRFRILERKFECFLFLAKYRLFPHIMGNVHQYYCSAGDQHLIWWSNPLPCDRIWYTRNSSFHAAIDRVTNVRIQHLTNNLREFGHSLKH